MHRLSLIHIFSVAALYQNSREKEKAKRRRRRDGILRGLPGFNNQLLLLLNSGLIFNDAFLRIAEGYENRTESPLGQVILEIRRQSEETGSSLTALMSRYLSLIHISPCRCRRCGR